MDTGEKNMTSDLGAQPIPPERKDFLKGDLLERGWTPSLIRRFLSVPDSENPRYGGGVYYLYAADRVLAIEASSEWKEAKEKLQRQEIPPKEIDLLAAIFAVNRAAKRFRNAAQATYRKRKHGFATINREKKEWLYSLKDRGIAAAFVAGRIAPVRMIDSWVEYRGEGYCFHSALLPKNVVLPTTDSTEPLQVEAKPRGIREPRLKDGVFTLEQLAQVPDCFRDLIVEAENAIDCSQPYYGFEEEEENEI